MGNGEYKKIIGLTIFMHLFLTTIPFAMSHDLNVIFAMSFQSTIEIAMSPLCYKHDKNNLYKKEKVKKKVNYFLSYRGHFCYFELQRETLQKLKHLEEIMKRMRLT
jgi:hypothetical protein